MVFRKDEFTQVHADEQPLFHKAQVMKKLVPAWMMKCVIQDDLLVGAGL